jgi:hypothetical protein
MWNKGNAWRKAPLDLIAHDRVAVFTTKAASDIGRIRDTKGNEVIGISFGELDGVDPTSSELHSTSTIAIQFLCSSLLLSPFGRKAATVAVAHEVLTNLPLQPDGSAGALHGDRPPNSVCRHVLRIDSQKRKSYSIKNAKQKKRN